MAKFIWRVGALLFCFNVIIFTTTGIIGMVSDQPLTTWEDVKFIKSMVLNIGIMIISKKLLDDEKETLRNRTFTNAKERQPPGQG